MDTRLQARAQMLVALCGGILFGAPFARAELPNPTLDVVFPAGGRAGAAVEITVEGSSLEGLSAIRIGQCELVVTKKEANRFSITIPAETPPGVYDARAIGPFGISSPRSFAVSDRTECIESRPNDDLESAEPVVLNGIVNGRIEKPGDVDCFRFTAAAGQRVVLHCAAERIDSPLRGVLELFDANRNRLAANRGDAGLDPLLDFRVPADGEYTVKLFDLTYAGGAAWVYRLEIDTGPRIEFAVPCVLEQGKTTRVALYGRNLGPAAAETSTGATSNSFDRVEVDITPAQPVQVVGLRLKAYQWSVDAFPYRYPSGHAPLLMGVTDVPVVTDITPGGNHSPGEPLEIAVPCEVSGQLSAGDEQDWYRFQANRGEVLWLEAWGERIGSPVDLDLVVLDSLGERQLAHWTDCLEEQGGYRFPTSHLDPGGRWVAPAAGRYLVMVRNLAGGLSDDPRRIYRLSIRREEPDFHVAVVSRRTDQPAALNVWRGGREMAEVLLLRHRGFAGPVRVVANNLPPGIECPEIWIGPGADRAPLVVTAGRTAEAFHGPLSLTATASLMAIAGPGNFDSGVTDDRSQARQARGGCMIRAGQPTGSGRLTDEIALGLGPESPLRVTASAIESTLGQDGVVFQDSVVDVAVEIERLAGQTAAPVNLSLAGLPPSIDRQIAAIPASEKNGWVSFYIPPSLPPGPYTFAVQADTEVSGAAGAGQGNVAGSFFSNPITLRVEPARISLEVDPRLPRSVSRGKIIQLGFTALRKNGFIGKVHTVLAAPGGVVGLRARGVTLVGQTDSGSLQLIANDDAPLGRQPFLRLEAVGTVEDRPVYRTSRFVELEITE